MLRYPTPVGLRFYSKFADRLDTYPDRAAKAPAFGHIRSYLLHPNFRTSSLSREFLSQLADQIRSRYRNLRLP